MWLSWGSGRGLSPGQGLILYENECSAFLMQEVAYFWLNHREEGFPGGTNLFPSCSEGAQNAEVMSVAGKPLFHDPRGNLAALFLFLKHVIHTNVRPLPGYPQPPSMLLVSVDKQERVYVLLESDNKRQRKWSSVCWLATNSKKLSCERLVSNMWSCSSVTIFRWHYFLLVHKCIHMVLHQSSQPNIV